MMNIRFLFLLLVFKATKCDKIVESETSILPKFDEKCKSIKCSAQEDPTCVKIKHLRDIKKVLHLIAVNKCELQFMKCHKDYEANIVAMKLCDHENILKEKKEQNSSMTHHVRVKRSIFRGDATTRAHDVFDSTSSEAGGGVKVTADHIYDEKLVLALKNAFSFEDEHGHKIHSSDIYYDADFTSKNPIIVGLKLAGNEEEVETFSGEPFIQEIESAEFQLFSAENIGERNNNAANAIPVNDNQCPDSCPAHADMICVKCVRGIYKTFLSSCHLRRYCCTKKTGSNRRRQVYRGNRTPPFDLCKGTSPKYMQLVSRHACILSAPYIARPGETSQGKVEDQHNNDNILDYFKCKSLDILGKSDPRCPY